MANELLTTGYDGVLGFVADPAPSGDPSLATFVTLTNAQEVNANFSVDKVEQSDRSSRYKLYCPGMQELEITATVRYTAATKAFIEYVLDRNSGTVQFLDKTGGEGWYFHCQVFSSDLAVPLTDGMKISLSFCPIRTVDFVSSEQPKWA